MALIAKDIVKDFSHTRVLHGINVTIESGDFLSISGRSGSGKSTLLYLLSTLDKPTSGQVIIDGLDTSHASSKEVDAFRAHHVGFVFQFHYLLPELTALENVLLPARNLGKQDEYKERALSLLDQFEVKSESHKYSGEMSGGQQQRVAIARALCMTPRYIFADEPTGNLDSYNAKKVMKMLIDINQQEQTTIVLVTHEQDFSRLAKRTIFLSDGRVVSEE